jgi:hypothetical protein
MHRHCETTREDVTKRAACCVIEFEMKRNLTAGLVALRTLLAVTLDLNVFVERIIAFVSRTRQQLLFRVLLTSFRTNGYCERTRRRRLDVVVVVVVVVDVDDVAVVLSVDCVVDDFDGVAVSVVVVVVVADDVGCGCSLVFVVVDGDAAAAVFFSFFCFFSFFFYIDKRGTTINNQQQ